MLHDISWICWWRVGVEMATQTVSTHNGLIAIVDGVLCQLWFYCYYSSKASAILLWSWCRFRYCMIFTLSIIIVYNTSLIPTIIGPWVKDNAFFYIIFCRGNSNWWPTFFSSAPSLFLVFRKSDNLIYITLTKIIDIMHALKMTFERWFPIM